MERRAPGHHQAEVVRLGDREPRDNPRFVVTNMRQTPRFLYEKVYCARGDVENRIKELKDLQFDRTSCCRLRANQLRVFLTAAAYVLMQELRLHAARTACSRAGERVRRRRESDNKPDIPPILDRGRTCRRPAQPRLLRTVSSLRTSQVRLLPRGTAESDRLQSLLTDVEQSPSPPSLYSTHPLPLPCASPGHA